MDGKQSDTQAVQLGLMDHRYGHPWDACGVPWAPELFSAPALQRILDKYRRERLRSVPSSTA